ncbi:glyoxalase [Pseudoroseomonas rhizosphaerae]|uniref:Glyoxalase n=1 Tax=Teichococcus rhizosphaerae TaxID=1335062 RepID=A0A2C7ADG1_9PROT|nr:VOC family protein [Pseudoroseomonas rhizosphaerae]PHK95114.1 glyoxalase [Pseudoroseomonas rhizosphaerae]
MSEAPHPPTPDPHPAGAPLAIAGVTLAARDAPRLAAFYAGLFGFESRPDPAEPGALRVGPAGRPLLRLLHRPQARPERGDEPGLFHAAFLLPGRAALAGWLHHALAQGTRLEGASDHGVSDALYLSDPEGNGIEVYADRPRAEWPRPPSGEGVAMVTRRLDLPLLLAAAPGPALAPGDTHIGHVHLRAGDLAATEAWYAALGLAVTQRMPRASFLGSGGYHHHVALNAWRSGGVRPEGLAGLVALELRASGPEAHARAAAGLGSGADPSGNRVRLAGA